MNDGGPAFPVPDAYDDDADGMTLRDYFAAKAMLAIFAGPGARTVADRDSRYSETKGNWAQVVALNAYEMADAMLLERNSK